MKRTEPWSDDDYTFNIEEALADIGCQGILTAAIDPRHRGILVQKVPLQHDPKMPLAHKIPVHLA